MNINENLMFELLDIANIEAQSDEALEMLDMFLSLNAEEGKLNVIFSRKMVNTIQIQKMD